MSRRLTSIIALWLTWLATFAQPLCRIVKYDEADGVSSSHITQLLQDEQGFMWFATWNGLCRYDGYEFLTFKPAVGDGCHMTTDRIRNITLLPGRQILCQVDEQNFMFDLTTYRFRDLTDEERQQVEPMTGKHRQSRSVMKKDYTWTDAHQTQWTLHTDGRLSYQQAGETTPSDYPLDIPFRTQAFAVNDRQGNLWALDYGSIYKLCTDIQRTKRLDITPHAEVKCLFSDRQGRCWVATKEDRAVRVYDNDRLLGYLGADGRLHPGYTSFGAAVYCMMQSADGTLWLGTKPDGLYRLRETSPGVFLTTHLDQLPHPDVYHIVDDRYGRLWVATLGGGVYYTDQPQAEKPRFTMPRHYPKADCPRARFLYITADDVLLVATSNGLLAAPLKRRADDMPFTLHQREPDRAGSLSCSATMDVVSDNGYLYVSTESGGINQTAATDLLAPQLTFRHLSEQFHVQPNDIVQSLTPMDNGGMMAVGSHLITLLDSTRQGRVLDARNFSADYRFSEAHPLALGNGRWLIGLTDGAFFMTEEQMTRQAYTPPLVLTRAAVQGGDSNWGIEHADTLTMQPSERSVTVHFAALDYDAPDRISYAFRLLPNEQWNYIGHDRSATLLDLKPGTYRLEIRSTNADGAWQPNNRLLTIVVKPTFWESAWGRLLIGLIIIATIAAIAYTYYYIRRIKRQQHETLEKYLALLDAGETLTPPSEVQTSQEEPSPSEADDPMLKRVMAYVEENIGNSDAGVGDMAAAAATSRSGLQRKLKQAMGITPQDLLREARIKHACQLLRVTDKTVAEVAYACGFTDPKYFGRCFKQSTGVSPTEYKNASN